MKKSLTNIILRTLEHTAIGTVNLAWALSTSKYESHRRFQSMTGRPIEFTIGHKVVGKLKVEICDYRKYHAILSRLSKQGLVEKNKLEGKTKWSITTKGRTCLNRKKNDIDFEDLVDKPGLTIISYDIPERNRRARGRLREILRLMGFKLIHQSMWFGNKKVTPGFLKLLSEIRIINYVHIFEVGKLGSLEVVKK